METSFTYRKGRQEGRSWELCFPTIFLTNLLRVIRVSLNKHPLPSASCLLPPASRLNVFCFVLRCDHHHVIIGRHPILMLMLLLWRSCFFFWYSVSGFLFLFLFIYDQSIIIFIVFSATHSVVFILKRRNETRKNRNLFVVAWFLFIVPM